jgi:hypothetical protein
MDTMICTNCGLKLITINHSSDSKPDVGDITACSFCNQPYQHDGGKWIPFTKDSYEKASSEVRNQIDIVWEAIEKFKQGMRDKGLIH